MLMGEWGRGAVLIIILRNCISIYFSIAPGHHDISCVYCRQGDTADYLYSPPHFHFSTIQAKGEQGTDRDYSVCLRGQEDVALVLVTFLYRP